MTKKKSVVLFDPKAKTGLSKRPDHPDFMTSTELKKLKFSGVRPNPISNKWEFWILGNIEKEVSFTAVKADKFALTKAHLEVFHMAAEPNVFQRK